VTSGKVIFSHIFIDASFLKKRPEQQFNSTRAFIAMSGNSTTEAPFFRINSDKTETAAAYRQLTSEYLRGESPKKQIEPGSQKGLATGNNNQLNSAESGPTNETINTLHTC
jgi:hypothetical protein